MVRIFFIGLSATLMAIIGAYFSIIGLSTLFAGASLEIAIMAGIMELSKLVVASFLYLYWNDVKLLLKSYLILALIILVTITSIGIYGFLTSAYQTSSDEYRIVQQRIENSENRRDRYIHSINTNEIERNSINENILTLSEALAKNQIQFVDRETGQLVTTTSAATRNVLIQQINELNSRRDIITNRIEAYRDSVTSIDLSILEIRQNSNISRELGPLRFISDTLGIDMNIIVNILSLLIMFTLDPLAISLVISLNMAIYLRNKQTNITMYGDNIEEANTEKKDNLRMTKEDIENLIIDTSKLDNVELKRDYSRRPIDIDGDGVVDGYDTNGDGLIDEKVAKSASHWRSLDYSTPYYAKSNFDWSNKSKWINDQNAINYWLTYVKDKYPTNFKSKTY